MIYGLWLQKWRVWQASQSPNGSYHSMQLTNCLMDNKFEKVDRTIDRRSLLDTKHLALVTDSSVFFLKWIFVLDL